MSVQPMTPEQFMIRFDFYVQRDPQEFFFKGCRDLLEETRGYGITTNKQQVEQFLIQSLMDVRDTDIAPDLQTFRQNLVHILNLDA